MAFTTLPYLLPLVFSTASRAIPAPKMAIDAKGVTTADKTAFAADPSIDVAGIYSAVQAATGDPLKTYPTSPEADHHSIIYGDWLNLKNVQALHFIADMDIDCDGVSSACPGHSSSESATAWGTLDTTRVPWFVIPDTFKSDHLHPNSLGAIICNGKMLYAIFGDTNGDGVAKDKEVTGEGSLLLGQACFPDDKITGNNGHAQPDVAYIIFGNQVPSGVGQSTIDIAALKTLGDKQVKLLQQALGLGGASDSSKGAGDEQSESDEPSKSAEPSEGAEPSKGADSLKGGSHSSGGKSKGKHQSS
ncbi:fungal chitosanase of glycosyl hydrolase group 75-domain-containing protein [Mycena vitilis]|nr:fungal chitosanase of glycosyl hydrolase group 75-domain-containing protein [Mycena vitilis]